MNGFDGLDLLGLITDALPQIQNVGGYPTAMDPLTDTGLGLPSGTVPEQPIPAAPLPLMPGESAGIPSTQYGGLRRSGSSRRSAPRIPAAPQPRKPSRITGNAGVDLTNLDLGELLFLVLHPQGPQVLTLMSQAQQQKRQEDIQRQQIALERAQMERSRRAQDMQVQMIMNQSGAVPVKPIQPGFGSDLLRAGTAGRRVTAPSGEEYLLPSYQDQQKAAIQAEEAKAQAAARAEVIKQQAKDAYEDSKKKTVTLIPGIPFVQDPITVRVKDEQLADTLKKARELQAEVKSGKILYPQRVEDDQGNVKIIGVDPQTNQQVVYDFGRIGKTKTAGSGGTAGFTPYQQYQVEKGRYDTARKAFDEAQTLINKARSLDQAKSSPGDPATDPDWQAARIAVENAVTQFPGYVRKGPGQGGYPDIVWTGKPPTAGSAGPSAGPSVTQSLEERNYALQRYRDMKKKGDPNTEAARQWFKRRYGLDPDTLQ